MDYRISTHKKNEVYEVRVNASVSKGVSDQVAREQLDAVHTSLDKAIPSAYRPKFNFNRRDMVLSIRAKEYNEAQGRVSELKKYLDEAIRKIKAQSLEVKKRDMLS